MPKRKRAQEEQEAAAHVFEEFVNEFQDGPCSVTKTFVKSSVLFANHSEVQCSEGQVYNPKSKLISSETNISNALECARILKQDISGKGKKGEKPKSNLEILKEELKLRHSERSEREKLKIELTMAPPALSYFEGGDPMSTNLFVANLNTKVSEADLMKEFGCFGPLASVKIMWPRGEDKIRNLNTNCGFVAFMSRRDAERALSHMKNRQDMRVGWGKSVDLPPNPIYVPQELLQLYLPPPHSGFPFNAQPVNGYFNDNLENLLHHSVVKVTIPLNKKVLMLVNRMVECVVKEGPMFEAMIMNNEIGNPEYSFLFEYKSPIHVYYRWRLFSVLQGDSVRHWQMKPFRMFSTGSVWIPPTAPNYFDGMPEELIRNKNDEDTLSENQCDRLVQLIQHLTLERTSIKEVMIFCLNHIPAIKDSLDIIMESLNSSTAKPPNLIARLYLLSDVLSNCKNWEIDKLEVNILSFMNHLKKSFTNLTSTSEKHLFRVKILRVIQHWDSSLILSAELIKDIEMLFSDGLDDGNSSSDEPLDGANLLKRSLKCVSDECVIASSKLKEVKNASKEIPLQYFVPSKWDTLDPEEVQAQVVSSQQIYYMETKNQAKNMKDISADGDQIKSKNTENESILKQVKKKKSETRKSRKRRSS